MGSELIVELQKFIDTFGDSEMTMYFPTWPAPFPIVGMVGGQLINPETKEKLQTITFVVTMSGMNTEGTFNIGDFHETLDEL
jgi:hypothetical protein